MLDATKLIELLGLRNASVQGHELICSCPFSENHQNGDRHPSFGIDLNTGLNHCFSCGESGTLPQLAQRVLGVSFMQAQQRVFGDLDFGEAQRIIDGTSTIAPERHLNAIECDVVGWSQQKHPYWAGRGFTEETIGHWNLGYDVQVNRVVVPIYFDHVLVGWTKRRVDESVQPKWEHSSGLPRDSILFGADEVNGKNIILVEAPLSAIMLQQQGIPNAVASFGCSLSQGQADLIRARYEGVLIFYDPDKAGHEGTKRAIKMLEPFVDVWAVGQTRDDPAAMSKEENMSAISSLVPSFSY